MRKGRVSDCILTSSHLIPGASAHAIWRVPRLVCVSPPKIRILSTLPHVRVSPTTVYSERRPFPDGRIISDYLSELCSAVMANGTSNVPIFPLLRSTTPRRSV